MDFKSVLLIIMMVISTVLSEHASNTTGYKNCPNVKTSLGSVRKRRHLAFPTGSLVSIATSAVKTFMTHVPSGWYWVSEVELVYHLPDAEMVAASRRRKLHHKQKRDAWELLETAFETRNLNGRACLLRIVCEAQMYLVPKGKSLVHDILRSLFTAHPNEEDFMKELGDRYSNLLETDFCEKPNDCPFSFLRSILDLNKYR